MIRCLLYILLLGAWSQLALAQSEDCNRSKARKLRGYVEILDANLYSDGPANNVTVLIVEASETGGTGVSDSEGIFCIPLPDHLEGGHEITFKVHNRKNYVIHKPDGGKMIIPADLELGRAFIQLKPKDSGEERAEEGEGILTEIEFLQRTSRREFLDVERRGFVVRMLRVLDLNKSYGDFNPEEIMASYEDLLKYTVPEDGRLYAAVMVGLGEIHWQTCIRARIHINEQHLLEGLENLYDSQETLSKKELKQYWVKVQYLLGNALACLGSYEEAAEHFNKYLRENPNDSKVQIASHAVRIAALVMKGQTQMLSNELDSLIEQVANQPEGFNLGELLEGASLFINKEESLLPNELWLASFFTAFRVDSRDAIEAGLRIAKANIEETHGGG